MKPKKKFKTFIILFTITISIFGKVQTVSGQSSFGRSVKAHAGESKEYQIAIVEGIKHYIIVSYTLENDTVIPINVTKGMKFTVHVNEVINNSVYIQLSGSFNGYKLTTKEDIDNSYVNLAFENKTYLNNYIKFYNNTLHWYSIKGDSIAEHSRTQIGNTTRTYNWRTGWLESFDIFNVYANGSFFHYQIAQASNEIFGINLDDIFTIITFAMVPVMFILGSYFAIKLKKPRK